MNRAENPHLRLDPVTAGALDAWEEEHRRASESLTEIQAALAPTEGELRIRHLLSRHAAQAAGLEAELMHRVQDQQSHKLDHARRFITARTRAHHQVPGISHEWPPPSSPSGQDFWWARTDWDHSDDLQSGMHAEGLVFTGGPQGQRQHNWLEDPDVIQAHFGAVAFFEIAAERVPDSPTGRWSSRPSVTLLGGLLASTTKGNYPGGDSWSKGWLHLGHQVFQWASADNVPAPSILGQAHAVHPLVDESNAGRTTHRPLPGFTTLPSIELTGLDTTRSVWARIEVRVDIQVEGAGAFLWCDPGAHLVTPAWPLRAVSPD